MLQRCTLHATKWTHDQSSLRTYFTTVHWVARHTKNTQVVTKH